MKSIRPDDPSEARDWTDAEAPKKYEDLTMGDEDDQDDEQHLIIQDDAQEAVHPKAPELRTRGGSPYVTKGDTRENGRMQLDEPVEEGAEVVRRSGPAIRRKPARAKKRRSTKRK